MTQTRARNLGLASIGDGNSTSFATSVHPEPEAMDARIAVEDPATLVRLAHRADSDDDFALILRSLDRANMHPDARTDSLRLAFRNEHANEEFREQLLGHWGTGDTLDDLVLKNHDASPAMLTAVGDRMPGRFDESGSSQRKAHALIGHPNMTDDLRNRYAAANNHHLHIALASSDQTPEQTLKNMVRGKRIGVASIVAIMKNPNTPRLMVAAYRFRDLFRRNA